MSPSAWILATADALCSTGSWCGRTHLHKSLYLSKSIQGAPVPFEFELYRFGPYSFDLDAGIRDLTVCGLLRKELVADEYGPKHVPAEGWRGSVETIEQEHRKRIEEMTTALHSLGITTVADLELVATCEWMRSEEGITDDEGICDAVRRVKPRYDQEQIRSKLGKLRELESKVSNAA